MNRVKRELFVSMVSNIDEEAIKFRKETIQTSPRLIMRTGKLALHALATNFQHHTAKLLGTEVLPTDLEYVGSGWNSTVFKQNNHVIKVNQRSALMDAQEQIEFATEKHNEYLAMAQKLGSVVIPQETFIAPHPYLKNLNAVQIKQPYQNIEDAHLFIGKQIEPNHQALSIIESNHPTAWNQLKPFVENSFSLYDNDKLVPDTPGKGNVVLRQGSQSPLTLIDGQPIPAINHELQGIALRQLEALGQYVS